MCTMVKCRRRVEVETRLVPRGEEKPLQMHGFTGLVLNDRWEIWRQPDLCHGHGHSPILVGRFLFVHHH